MDVLIISLSITGWLVINELLARFTNIPGSIIRKVAHTGAGVVVVVLSLHYSYHLFIPIGVVLAGVLYATHYFGLLCSFHDRRDESLGELYFALGVAAAALVSPNVAVFQAAVLVLAISDTVAYFVGNNIKSHKIYHKKTIAGTTGFMVSSLVILLCCGVPLPVAIGASLVCGGAELFAIKGSDNLSIPLLGSIILKFFW